jgi:hypothetical protein
MVMIMPPSLCFQSGRHHPEMKETGKSEGVSGAAHRACQIQMPKAKGKMPNERAHSLIWHLDFGIWHLPCK